MSDKQESSVCDAGFGDIFTQNVVTGEVSTVQYLLSWV
jgi:hypothetical protein